MSGRTPGRLAAIAKLVFEVIPQDPAGPEYRQGDALGDAHTYRFRARFFPQYLHPTEATGPQAATRSPSRSPLVVVHAPSAARTAPLLWTFPDGVSGTSG